MFLKFMLYSSHFLPAHARRGHLEFYYTPLSLGTQEKVEIFGYFPFFHLLGNNR